MIKKDFGFKALKPKNVSGDKTVFDIAHKDKEGTYHYVSVMCDHIDLADKEEVKITEIEGLTQHVYKSKDGDKVQTTLYCKVERKNAPAPRNEPTTQDEDFNTEPLIDINSDDLPF